MKVKVFPKLIWLVGFAIIVIVGGFYYCSSRECFSKELTQLTGVGNISQLELTDSVHPLSIESLRGKDFPGSEVVIERELARGGNYSRYIASYRSEGLKIFALLTVPNGEKPETGPASTREGESMRGGWPVIVFNHGWIQPSQYHSDEKYVAYTDGFSRNGYIVFRPDYRGHGDSEGFPEGAYNSNAYTIDVLNAVSSVKRFPDADPERIGMWGHSMGGFITVRSMVVDYSIKAGVIWGGVVGSYNDLIDVWWANRPIPRSAGSSRERWRRTRENLRELQKNQELIQSISANSFLSDISGPIQLHHGEADASVPFKLSQILHDELKEEGKTSELYLYPGTDHNLSQSFSQAMQRSVEFFDEHVKGEI